MPFRWLLSLWFFAGFSCQSFISHAQGKADHLYPVSGYFNESSPAYYAKVRETLYAGLATAPLLSTVVCPSFRPEYALFITEKEGQYLLTYRVCQTSIWSAGHFAYAKPPKSKPVTVTTKTVAVTQPLVEALTQVFGKAIAQTKYPEPAYGHRSDGTTHTFVAFIEGLGTVGGETWSPRAGTNMGALVDLAANLKKLVETPAEQDQTALVQRAHQLLAQLASKD